MPTQISIFGMGYVGVVSAACLASDGHTVIGVDPNPTKVELINSAHAPIVEAGLEAMIEQTVRAGRLRATASVAEAIEASELSLICVGTPSQLNGNLDLTYVRRVCEEIGRALRDKAAFHAVVLRSTMLPGTMADLVIPTLEAHSGKKAGVDFGVGSNPEFLREGTAVYDYRNPPKTVIGELDSRTGDMLEKIYAGMDAPLVRTALQTAEMVKYVDNVWHALKVAFANEVGNICKAVDIDSHQVMDIFCQDTKLNLSPYYLKPGFAFGGSCLPKDLRAITYKAKVLDVETPILNAILPSNALQIDRGLDMIVATGKRRIGVLGVSFKAGTDDLRESPLIEVIERLLGKGYDLRVYDENVKLASLRGANRDFLLNHVPHINRLLMDSADQVLAHAEVVVVGNGAPEFREVLARTRPDQTIIDLVRVGRTDGFAAHYDGICW